MLEDHALESLLSMLFELFTDFILACRLLHLQLVFFFLFFLFLAHHHIIIAETGAKSGHLAHQFYLSVLVDLWGCLGAPLGRSALNLNVTACHLSASLNTIQSKNQLK